MGDRQSSDHIVNLAQRAMRHPGSLNEAQIRSLAGSVLSQARPGPVAKLLAIFKRT